MDMPRGDADVLACVYAHVCGHVWVRVCAHICAHVWAHMCAGVIREIKLLFQDNAISLYHLYLIYMLNPIIFCHVGLFLCFYVRM